MRSLMVVSLMCFLPALAAAQDDRETTRRLRIGPVTLTPAIAIKNVGIDTNVFYQSDDPKQDFTATLAPSVEARMKAGAVRLVGTGGADFVYFERYKTERAINTRAEVRLEVPWNRFTPYVAGSLLKTRERPGMEIDLRARRFEDAAEAGGQFRIGGATKIGLQARRARISFDGNDVFLGRSLSDSLNRRTEAFELSVRQDVTPLTRLVLELESSRERFEASPLRDSDTFRVMPGVEFDTLALIAGRASVGYRRVIFRASDIPAYAGVVGDVALSHTLRGMTRVALSAHRDVAFSVLAGRPYYLETGVGGSITQHLIGAWDVVGRLHHARLDYRALRSSLAEDGQVDTVSTLGAGLGYRAGAAMRLGIDLDRSRRQSVASFRRYDGMRVATSVTYGF